MFHIPNNICILNYIFGNIDMCWLFVKLHFVSTLLANMLDILFLRRNANFIQYFVEVSLKLS
jgi:hypothetical protein